MESNVTNENEVGDKVLTMNVTTMIKGLIELGSLPIQDFELNMKIAETVRILGIAEKSYIKSASALVKTHIQTNEKGVALTEGEGPYKSYVYKSLKDKEKYLEEMRKLNETVVSSVSPGIIKMSQLKALNESLKAQGSKVFVTAYIMMKLGVLIENDLKK